MFPYSSHTQNCVKACVCVCVAMTISLLALSMKCISKTGGLISTRVAQKENLYRVFGVISVMVCCQTVVAEFVQPSMCINILSLEGVWSVHSGNKVPNQGVPT